MSVFLLDVNVLVALVWPAHQAHGAVQQWFERNSQHAWATCPFTQAGFVRVLSNPVFSRDAVAPQEAVRVLDANLKHRFHRFWPDGISYAEAVEALGKGIGGHRQVTDAYLLGLAIHHRSKLATMDRTVRDLLPQDYPQASSFELIS